MTPENSINLSEPREIKNEGITIDWSERPNISEEDRRAIIKMCLEFMEELRGTK